MSINTHSGSPFGPVHPARTSSWRVLAWSGFLVVLDFAAGPVYAVSLLFVLPVISAAWHQGFRFACYLAAGLSVLRFVCHWAWGFPVHFNAALFNNILRGATLIAVAFLTEQLASEFRSRKKRLQQLEARLPICPSCGIVHYANGQWGPLGETGELSKTTPPKSLCPDCERRHYESFSG